MTYSKTYSFKIQPQFVDFQFRVTMGALTDILLTTAGMNADDNGFGLRQLHAAKSSWVLLRLALEMVYFPEQYETIHVETWIEEIGRASTTRNFCIRNDKNEIIGNACSIWAMLDMETRRAKDLRSLDGIHRFASGIKGSIEPPIKILGVDGEIFDSFKVKYSDIDINQHVNSVRYINWISDCFSLETYRTKAIKRFEINYMNEMLFDDKVVVFGRQIDENDFKFEIRNDDKISCRVRILFK
ncbi:MAG: thioesterase [Paludibacter sp.]|nr:thioesterase [Paludibacter sp.]